MGKYQITKRECRKAIDENDNVCEWCGHKLTPIKTVNNSGDPTYWIGCLYCGHFTVGVKKELFGLAEKLVCDGAITSNFLKKHDYSSNQEERLFWFQNQVSRSCDLLVQIEYLKYHKPRKTKKEFLKGEFF